MLRLLFNHRNTTHNNTQRLYMFINIIGENNNLHQQLDYQFYYYHYSLIRHGVALYRKLSTILELIDIYYKA